MLATMRGLLPRRRRPHEPQGGLFTWLTFPDGFDAARFMAETLLPEAKVAYVPGATFFPVRQEPNHARLSYLRGGRRPTRPRRARAGPAAAARAAHALRLIAAVARAVNAARPTGVNAARSSAVSAIR